MSTSPSTSSTRAADVNPYTDWLKLPEQTTNPNPYELLRLERFEASQKLIQAGRDRQRRALQTVKEYVDPELWAKVAAEVEQAHNRLASRSWRMVIDAGLRRADLAAGRGLAPADASASHMLACPCGAETSAQRPFCGKCGQPLWRMCSSCQTPAAVNETFCGVCGGNLDQVFEAALTGYGEKLAQARKDLDEHRFTPARQALLWIASLQDPRFGELGDAAALLFEEMEDRFEQARNAASSALKKALELQAAHAYEEVEAVLAAIPAEMRTPEHDALQARAATARNEVQSLLTQIRVLMSKSQINGLGRLLDRLLVLQPQHETGQKLGRKVAQQCQKRAEVCIRNNQFELAQQWLDQIPEFVGGDRTDALQDAITEVRWLASDIRYTPWVDNVLPRLLPRLEQIAPAYVQDKLGELKQQLAAARPGAAWFDGSNRPLPRPIRLGVPTAAERWNLDFVPHREQWLNLQTGFEIALGLALQGLAILPSGINFVESRSTGSLLGRMLKKKAANRVWGVDLGEFSLKAVCLELSEDGRPAIVDWLYDEHQAPLKHADPHDREQHQWQSLRQVCERIGDSDAKVCVSLPGSMFIMRLIRMPEVKSKAALTAIKNQAQRAFPMDLEQLTWRSHQFPNADQGVGVHTLLLAARKEHVSKRIAQFEAAGLKPDLAQCDFMALHNLLQYEHFPQPTMSSGKTALALDFGFSSSSLVIAAPDFVFFRSLPLSGKKLSELMTREFHLTSSQAETVKRDPLRAKSLSKLYTPLEPRWRQLLQETQTSLEAFRRQYSDHAWVAMYGIGGGFRQHGVMRIFNVASDEK